MATALFVGFSKAGLPGAGILAVPLMALAFEGKSSVGVLLPLLIMGDLLALLRYRHKAKWSDIRGVALWIALGMVLGAIGLKTIDAKPFRPFLGAMVLALLGLELLRNLLKWHQVPHHPLFASSCGMLTGIATTIGNAAGPIMTVYLLARKQDKFQFVGSMAWMFFCINLAKVPIYSAMGLITSESLIYDLKLIPGIVVGALIGIWLLPKINQNVFKWTVLALATFASVRLLML